tara:strand:- start:555 stop:1073 length:519 start_codon:yes stop_codon:yes gene_type:complete
MRESEIIESNPVDRIAAEWERERPDLDASPLAIFGRITRINLYLGKHVNTFLEGHGLSLGLFDVLTALRRAGKPFRLKPSDLADMTMLTSGGMTGRIDQLEELGYVRRISDDNDRRVMFAELTPDGLQLIDMLIELHFLRESELLEGIGPEDKKELSRILMELDNFISRTDL